MKTLKNVKEIGGFKVVDMDELRKNHPDKFNEHGAVNSEWFEKEIAPDSFIFVQSKPNSISFTIQSAPVQDVGINGCQVDTIIETAKLILEGLNENIPCRENSLAITKLDEALMWLQRRKENRIKRGVEGTGLR